MVITIIITIRIIMSNLFDSAVILLTAAQTKLSGRAGAIVKSGQMNHKKDEKLLNLESENH